MTKHDLKGYLRMKAEMGRLDKQITELRRVIQSPKTSSITGMPRGGGHLTMDDEIHELDLMIADYSAQWDALVLERMRIERAIRSLPDTLERALMGYRYIDGLTWEEICVKISCGWDKTHRLHRSALIKLSEI